MPDVSIDRIIRAKPSEVWALVSDPTRMGDWSPENIGAKWVGGASGPSVGAKFRGSNSNGRVGWKTTCTVTECQADEHFAFDVKSGPLPIATWGYRLEAVDGGTKVTEYYDRKEPEVLERLGSKILGIDDRSEHNRAGMIATLDAMAAELEA